MTQSQRLKDSHNVTAYIKLRECLEKDFYLYSIISRAFQIFLVISISKQYTDASQHTVIFSFSLYKEYAKNAFGASIILMRMVN